MSRLTGTSRLLSPGLHAPGRRARGSAASRPAGLRVELRPWPCDGPRLRMARQGRLRLRRMLLEAALTGLATTVLTSLALTHPAVLRESPATTLSGLIAPLTGGSAGLTLSDCP